MRGSVRRFRIPVDIRRPFNSRRNGCNGLLGTGAYAVDKQTIQVTIFHQNYTLRTSGNERDVQEIADSVDQLMTAIGSKSPNADPLRVAVLACMHLADRLRALENDLQDWKRRVDAKSEQFRAQLEQAIGGE
jgi:cell division protein ZapA